MHRELLAALRPRLAFDADDVERWRTSLDAELRRLIGWSAFETRRVALAPRSLWSRELSYGRVEKLVFSAEPGAEVPAYVVTPARGAPPYPVMICLQGHSPGMHQSVGLSEDESVEVPVDGARDFARQCARLGIAALCLEQRSLGERRERQQAHINRYNPCHDAAMHALMLGRTLLGERVYDVERAVELIRGRADLDAHRIGITGNSGGGTVALWAAALIPALGFAMPSCALCSFRSSLMSVYHCTDNYIPGILPVAEMADIAGLIAPRRLLVIAGEQDPLFPIAGVRECFGRVKHIYAAVGAPERTALVVGPEGHRFYPELAWPLAETWAQVQSL